MENSDFGDTLKPFEEPTAVTFDITVALTVSASPLTLNAMTICLLIGFIFMAWIFHNTLSLSRCIKLLIFLCVCNDIFISINLGSNLVCVTHFAPILQRYIQICPQMKMIQKLLSKICKYTIASKLHH